MADGDQVYREYLTREPSPPTSPLSHVAREFVYGEIWARPGLTRRDRRWIGLVCATAAHSPQALDMHVYGALNTGDTDVEALTAFLVHFATYRAWAKASILEEAVVRQWAAICAARGETVTPRPSIATDRLDVMIGHVGSQGALTARDERIIAICCLALDGSPGPIRTHVDAALRGGDLTAAELDEIALHFAVYGGFPRGSALGGIISAACAAAT